MTTLQITCYAVLTALVILYPKDCLLAPAYLGILLKLVLVNYWMMFQAWQMHRRLAADFAKIGLPMPAFKFIPIWERQHGTNT
jgi:hypothetical protein